MTMVTKKLFSLANSIQQKKKKVAVLDWSTVLDFSRPRFTVDGNRCRVRSERRDRNRTHQTVRDNRTVFYFSDVLRRTSPPVLWPLIGN